MLAETAGREIFEETGIRVRLGVPVGVSRYRMPSKRQKIVHYWAAEATDAAIRASAFVPNKEIAALEWVTPKKALGRLSYPVDVEILENFVRLVDDGVLRTFPIIALRHGKALAREEWDGKDTARPLAPRGKKQANAIVGPLLAFGVRKIISSPATRCVKTVTPLSAALGRKIDKTTAHQPGRVGGGQIGRAHGRRRARALAQAGGAVQPRPGAARDHHRDRARHRHAARLVSRQRVGARDRRLLGRASVVDNPGSGIVAIETHAPKV